MALHDNCSPWLTFLVQITFEESRNYTDHDRGLLTFLKKGDAEDWRLEEVLMLHRSLPPPPFLLLICTPSKVEGKIGDYQTPFGWEEVELNETNVAELQPRCGVGLERRMGTWCSCCWLGCLCLCPGVGLLVMLVGCQDGSPPAGRGL